MRHRAIRRTWVVGTLVFAAAISAAAGAQRGFAWRGGGGWGHGGPYGRLYDPKTVSTVAGEIASIDLFTPMQGMRGGVHLQLKTGTDLLPVHLGPSWFIENQDTKLEVKDKVEVKGSRVVLDGKLTMIAAEVKKGDEVLKLRDEAGVPYWAGWRRHRADASRAQP